MKQFITLPLLISLVSTFLLWSCAEEEKVQPEKPKVVEEFTPPEDGKIAPAQADAYVKASLALTRALKEQEKVVREFTKKHELKEDLSQLADSGFMKDHPEVTRDWNELTKKWSEREREAYKVAKISEEEFNWIGGALTDTLNKEIQREIAQKLSAGMEGMD